ncbi:NUDIX hydrolase [Pseudomonas chlororaphis]|uniref:NUDIX hydrolase n=1 Tax=Pseudomonas chlororaphis TaxID=587753 RepID=A0AB34C7N4_9PSED|nr:NUDIX hydrolase [Pseudomonas chlororaphis]AZD01775.1 hypothetical protein C4K27_2581 [Pseudomonas chlororaphis subsp. chlororaphis]KAA5842588.1 NUDIX hydrolase [Pseudomonas chlororaphis]MBM0282963.1 NUDIX hydrolase [Pseudomonas chlororaphis]MDO1507308.1 NUDIX hydrolase [Pseudomonas chlororaphis]ORM45403.1 hypothetical protein B6D51_25485 [Pseudomonas chlororaphis subsp. chlororaphis]
MTDKAYAILLYSEDEDNGYLYFPIKRANLVYGGMPQFFGGTKNAGETDHDTIAREMKEESDGKITLGAGGLTSIYKSRVGNNNYSFYVAENYQGKNFLGSLTNSEMSSIQQFFVQIGQEDDVEDLLKSLKIVPTAEFIESETYEAFNKAIAWSEK